LAIHNAKERLRERLERERIPSTFAEILHGRLEKVVETRDLFSEMDPAVQAGSTDGNDSFCRRILFHDAHKLTDHVPAAFFSLPPSFHR